MNTAWVSHAWLLPFDGSTVSPQKRRLKKRDLVDYLTRAEVYVQTLASRSRKKGSQWRNRPGRKRKRCAAHGRCRDSERTSEVDSMVLLSSSRKRILCVCASVETHSDNGSRLLVLLLLIIFYFKIGLSSLFLQNCKPIAN